MLNQPTVSMVSNMAMYVLDMFQWRAPSRIKRLYSGLGSGTLLSIAAT